MRMGVTNISFLIAIVLITRLTYGAVVHVPLEIPTIQEACNQTTNGDTILVADGEYTGALNRNLDFNGKSIVLRSIGGPDVCIIDCQNLGRGFYFHSGETSAAVIDGFTIQEGSAENGGGICCLNGASPTIINCYILRNSCTGEGSAIYSFCQSTATATFTNCRITDNENGSEAIMCYGPGNVFNNCLITNNSGVAISCYFSNASINNCTIATNDSGIYTYRSSPILLNSIVWNSIYIGQFCYPSASYSDTLSPFQGTGNISMDPEFVTGPDGNFYLQQIAAGQPDNSPCVDAGAGLATDTCFTLPGSFLCMGVLSTLSNQEPDTGITDMGFHYPKAPAPAIPAFSPLGLLALIGILGFLLCTF